MLSVVIPLLNEEKNIHRLVGSIASQTKIEKVDVIFVDNGSRDRTIPALKDEVKLHLPQAEILTTSTPGKYAAVQHALLHLKNHSRCQKVAILDADSYYATEGWIEDALTTINKHPEENTYIYSPFTYFGFDTLPNFQKIYMSYNKILTNLMRTQIWFGNGQAVIYDISRLEESLAVIHKTGNMRLNEGDLKISFYLLSKGAKAIFQEEKVMTSGRRIIQSRLNFNRWINYDPHFYNHHWDSMWEDGYLTTKDIPTENASQIFLHRANKLVFRNLLPLFFYDKTNNSIERLTKEFGEPKIQIGNLPLPEEIIAVPGRFEALVTSISKTSYAKEVSAILAQHMIQDFQHNLTISDYPHTLQ